MTPTLLGRWQTRVFLALFLGVPLTVFYMWIFDVFLCDPYDVPYWKLPLIFAYVTALGFGWDILWILLQSLRWDRDWPWVFQLSTGAIEGAVVFGVFYQGYLWPLTFTDVTYDDTRFLWHYGTIWLSSFLFLIGPVKVLLPRWRYRGGQLLGGR